MNKGQGLGVGLGVLFLLGGLLLQPMIAHAVLKAGKQAPGFTMQLFSGESLTLEKLRGKPVVLNFFASWCPHCQREAPVLAKVAKEYQKKGVVFVGVNIWDKEPEARRFVQEKGITYFVGRDGNEAISTAYDIQGTPTTYFIGRDGKIKAVHEGAMSEERLTQQIEALLKSR